MPERRVNRQAYKRIADRRRTLRNPGTSHTNIDMTGGTDLGMTVCRCPGRQPSRRLAIGRLEGQRHNRVRWCATSATYIRVVDSDTAESIKADVAVDSIDEEAGQSRPRLAANGAEARCWPLGGSGAARFRRP
jgi:hypothetical protein